MDFSNFFTQKLKYDKFKRYLSGKAGYLLLSTLTRKLIKAESKLKFAEDSENNRNFQESKIKTIQICQKFSIFNILNG